VCLRKGLSFNARFQYALKIYYQLKRIHKIQGTQNVEVHFLGLHLAIQTYHHHLKFGYNSFSIKDLVLKLCSL